MRRALNPALLLAVAMTVCPGRGFAEGPRIYAAGSLTGVAAIQPVSNCVCKAVPQMRCYANNWYRR
jgi:hypothetical protein